MAFTFLLVSLELLALDLEVFVLVRMLYIPSVRTINGPSLRIVFGMNRNFLGLDCYNGALHKQTTPAQRQKLKYAGCVIQTGHSVQHA